MTARRCLAMLVALVVASVAACLSRAPATGAAPGCTPASATAPRIVAGRNGTEVAAHVTPLTGGGAVVSLADDAGVTVIAVDRSGCERWRSALPGGYPIVRPVQPGAGTLVIASSTRHVSGGALRISTLSLSSGRVIRSDVFEELEASAGRTTLLTTGHGDVAAVLAASKVPDGGGSRTPVTLVLTRRGLRGAWRRQVLLRANRAAPAAAIHRDGTIAVAYLHAARLLVRTGTIAGAMGPPADVGPVGRSFRSAAVAIGAGGTIVAAWQSTRYSLPWRLRAAVGSVGRGRFGADERLGASPGTPHAMFDGQSPALRVGARGRVMVGFAAPGPPPYARSRLMCARATPSGGFGPAREVAGVVVGTVGDVRAMLFGRAGGVAVSEPVGAADAGTSLVSIDSACRARGSRSVGSEVGSVADAAIDRDGRVWLLGVRADGVRLAIATPHA